MPLLDLTDAELALVRAHRAESERESRLGHETVRVIRMAAEYYQWTLESNKKVDFETFEQWLDIIYKGEPHNPSQGYAPTFVVVNNAISEVKGFLRRI